MESTTERALTAGKTGAIAAAPDVFAQVIVDAYLAMGERADAREAVVAAAKARGLPASALMLPEGDVREALGAEGGAIRPALAAALRGALARGASEALRSAPGEERPSLEERLVRSAAGARGAAVLSLPAALEEASAAEDLERLGQRALELATEGGEEARDLLGWLDRMRGAPTAKDIERMALAGLALRLSPRPAEALLALATTARSAAVLRWIASGPESRDAKALAALWSTGSAPARACVVWVLRDAGIAGTAEAWTEALLAAASSGAASSSSSVSSSAAGAGAAPVPTAALGRFAAAAELFSGLRNLGGEAAADQVVESLARGGCPPPEVLAGRPARTVGMLELAATVVEHLGRGTSGSASAEARHAVQALGAAVVDEWCHRVRAGADMGEAEPVIRVLTSGATPSLVAEVATKLMAVMPADASPEQMAPWAELQLRCGRVASGVDPEGAVAFYVNLCRTLEKGVVPSQLGAAAALVARVGDRGRQNADESAVRIAGEELARADRASADGARRSTVTSFVRAPRASAGDERLGSTSVVRDVDDPLPESEHKIAAGPRRVVEGIRLNPPGRVLEVVRVLTGYEFLRAGASLIGRALRYRRQGRLEIDSKTASIEQTSELMGQRIRHVRYDIPTESITRVRRVERAPATLLVLGVLVLVVLTWFGVSVAFDGFAIHDGVLVAAGFGSILVGLVVDAVLYSVFRMVRGSTILALSLRNQRRSVRFAVPRAHADAVTQALLNQQ